MTVWDDLGLVSKGEFQSAVAGLHQRLTDMEARMGAREDAAYEKLNATITTVKDGWAALQAENANLKSQLEAAQVDFQAQLDADSEADASKVEAADSALSELVSVAEEPAGEEPVDETPVSEEPAPGDLPVEEAPTPDGETATDETPSEDGHNPNV